MWKASFKTNTIIYMKTEMRDMLLKKLISFMISFQRGLRLQVSYKNLNTLFLI